MHQHCSLQLRVTVSFRNTEYSTYITTIHLNNASRAKSAKVFRDLEIICSIPSKKYVTVQLQRRLSEL